VGLQNWPALSGSFGDQIKPGTLSTKASKASRRAYSSATKTV
jgi:hypothetical protein